MIARLTGAALILAGLALNPVTIAAVTGRQGLSAGAQFVIVAGELFLVLLGAAIATRGRGRGLAFHGLALALPLFLLAGLEALLTVFPSATSTEDMRHFQSWGRWPSAMMRDDRFAKTTPYRLYKPFRDEVVTINSDGLRTAEASAKAPGEWRIAVTGGSTAWGWRIADSDTLAAGLQRIMAEKGHASVKVFNFGIESAVLGEEVALLKDWRDRYGIDQMIFYTAGNDAWASYARLTEYQPHARAGALGFVSQLAVFRTAMALLKPVAEMKVPPDDAVRPLFEAQVAPALAEAQAYCRDSGLVCDLILQPWIGHKDKLHQNEVALKHNTERTFGPVHGFVDAHYRLYAPDPALPVHDLRDALDGEAEAVFGDMIHVNERGNARLARAIFDHLAPTRAGLWTKQLSPSGDR